MRKKFTCYRCGKYVETEMDNNGDATCPACENVIELEPERRFQTRIASLESQLAARDALIERLVEAGEDRDGILIHSHGYSSAMYVWRKIVAEWQAMKGGVDFSKVPEVILPDELKLYNQEGE